jgi:putative ABC transport system permease protein
VLLVGATLLIRSFVNILEVDPGFDPRGVVTVHMAVPPTKYETPEQAAAFYARLVERLRTLPGVASAGATNQVPLSGDDYGGAFVFEGHPDAGAQADNEYDGFRYSAGYRAVTPGYLEALAVTLEKGRFLRDSDTAAQPPVAVVNEAFVRQFLPETDPIGVRFKYAGMDRVNPYFTIVGVIKDIHHASLVKGSKPETYVSLYQAPFRAQWRATRSARSSPTRRPRSRRSNTCSTTRSPTAASCCWCWPRSPRSPSSWRRRESIRCCRRRWRSARRKSGSGWRSARSRRGSCG